MIESITVQRFVAASPPRVWAAWTTESGLAGWWWKHLPGNSYEIDARPGGRYRITSPAAGIGVRGEYLEMDEPNRFLATWIWLDDGGEGPVETITVTFLEAPAGTLQTIVHTGPWTTAEPANAYEHGWNDTLDALAQSLLPDR